MVDVCVVCGTNAIMGQCDECNVNLCYKHLKKTGKNKLCPKHFEEFQEEEGY